MAISIDYSGVVKRIIVPQADLTPVSGSLYELNTETLRTALKALEANDTGIVFTDTHQRNAPYTVGGFTYAQSIEILNDTVKPVEDEYELFFSPDTQYSVRLTGSNNNVFDLQNAILANTVTQVIPTNSGGLINGDISDQTVEGSLTMQQTMRIVLSALAGKLSGAGTGTVTIRDTEDTIDRIVATTDDNGNRITVTLDVSD